MVLQGEIWFFDYIFCLYMPIHHEGFICLDQLDCQGTYQQCFVEVVYFLSQASSSLIWNEAPNVSN